MIWNGYKDILTLRTIQSWNKWWMHFFKRYIRQSDKKWIKKLQGWGWWSWTGFGWHRFGSYHYLLGCAWADGSLAESAVQPCNIVEHWNHSQPNPPAPPCSTSLSSTSTSCYEKKGKGSSTKLQKNEGPFIRMKKLVSANVTQLWIRDFYCQVHFLSTLKGGFLT